MNEFLIQVGGMALASSGLAFLRLSQKTGRGYRGALQGLGSLLILGALILFLRQFGGIRGSTAFCGSLTVGVLALAFLEPRFPRMPALIGPAGAILGVVFGLAGLP